MDKSITQATQNDKQISKSIKRFFTRFMFAQLCIRYALQLGTISLPKTADPEHMKTNAEVDFEMRKSMNI